MPFLAVDPIHATQQNITLKSDGLFLYGIQLSIWERRKKSVPQSPIFKYQLFWRFKYYLKKN